MTHSESELVEGYAAVVGVSQLIPDEALDWQPGSEGWSLRSIMSHLAHANDFYVMIIDQVRASEFADVQLRPEMAGFSRMEATDTAIAHCRTAADVHACFEATYRRLLAAIQTLAVEELDQPFNMKWVKLSVSSIRSIYQGHKEVPD